MTQHTSEPPPRLCQKPKLNRYVSVRTTPGCTATRDSHSSGIGWPSSRLRTSREATHTSALDSSIGIDRIDRVPYSKAHCSVVSWAQKATARMAGK